MENEEIVQGQKHHDYDKPEIITLEQREEGIKYSS